MRTPLLVAVAQPLSEPHDVAGNARRHADTIRAAHARVVVFPELSLTGYELAADTVAPDDPRLSPIVDACAATGSVALVGAPIDGPHIAFLAVDGSGVTVAYRKLWLGDEEARRFVPGPEPVAIEVDGWRLGLGICRDTGIPQHWKDTAALGIDAYVAGVVKHDHESSLMDERADRIAAEHGVWVAVASFAGPTGGGFDRTAGGSSIRTPAGVVVARAGDQPGDLATGTLT